MSQPLDDIQHIDAVTAIRHRPELYVGPLEQPNAINVLLREALCIALDNSLSGCSSENLVSFFPDGSVSIWDNGPGMSVTTGQDGRTGIERLLTQLFACREAKRHPLHKSLCGVGIVVTNALRERLIVETVEDGCLWRQEFSRGQSLGPAARLTPESRVWQQLTFLPDRALFGDRRLDSVGFIKWFQEHPIGSRRVTLTIKDLTTGRMQNVT